MSRRVIIVICLVLVGALLAGLWFGRRPIISAVKEWRAESLVSKAENEAAEGRPREAAQAATAAWQLGPRKIETLRRLMEQGRKGGLGDLPAVTLLVFFHEDHVPADRLDILKTALDRGDPAFFDQLYPNLDEAARIDPAMRLLHARKLALQGRILEAVEEARALEGSAVSEVEVSLLLIELLPRLPGNPVAAKQAKERIVALLGNEDPKISLRAWRLLPLLPVEIRDPGPGFDPVAWVAAQSEATPADRVAASRMAVDRLPVDQREKAMETFAKALIADEKAVASVARWYLEAGKGERLLDLPESVFLKDTAVFSSRLQVLLEKERFDEAKAWLAKAPQGFPSSVAGSLEAVFARREGRASEALTAWRRVIEQASSLQVYGDCLSILRVAERYGEEKAAADVVEVIVSLPPNRLPPSEHLEFLESRFAGRPEAWLAFWRGILRFRPGDPFATEQVSFFELGETVPIDAKSVLDRTEKALRRFPTVPRFRATHALWLMRDDRAAEALTLLREADLNWNEAEPMARAAYSLALLRNGSQVEAQSLAAGIRWERIGPLRRALLVSLLNEKQTSPPS